MADPRCLGRLGAYPDLQCGNPASFTVRARGGWSGASACGEHVAQLVRKVSSLCGERAVVVIIEKPED